MALGSLQGCDKRSTSGPIRVAVPAGPEGSAVRQLSVQYRGGVTVEVADFPYDTLRQKLNSTSAANQGEFDAVLLDDPWFPLLSRHLAELKGVPADLTADVVPKSLDLCREPYRTGTLKALPFVGNTQLLFVRRDRLPQRATLPNAPTWFDIATIAEEISSVGRASKTPFVGYAIRGRAGAPVVTDFLPIYWSLGGQLTQEANGKTVSVADAAKLERAIQIYAKLARQSPKGSLTFDWNEMTSAFEDGSAAMQLNWPVAIDRLSRKLGPPAVDGNWDIILPPGVDGPGTSMIGNWLLGVPANSPRPTEATAFVVWLLQQQATVAGPVTPPTRSSVFASLAAVKQTAYMAKIEDALKRSTARDRTARWGQIEEIVSFGIHKALSDSTPPKDSASLIASTLDQTFKP